MSHPISEHGILEQRILQLEAAVGDLKARLVHCVQVASRPQDALALARGIAESIVKKTLLDMGRNPPDMLEPCLRDLEKSEVMSRGLVPAEIITLLHMIRVLGNKATHDAMKIVAGPSDVDLVLRSVLRVVEWYFAEFSRGPHLNPLFTGGLRPPPVPIDASPPQARMPALVVSGPQPDGTIRKVFVFTERLIGIGREKRVRDPRVHIVARLLPCPDASHTNWNANLTNLSQFHAQIWWEMGRLEIRDENSDAGVFINGVRIGRGVWTPCSFSDPAQVGLGPAGVHFSIAEVVRRVGQVEVQCVRISRSRNWPSHEYLLVSRPLVTIGSDPSCVAWFRGTPETLAMVEVGDQGWLLRTNDGEATPIDPGTGVSIAGSCLVVKRTSDEDFLS